MLSIEEMKEQKRKLGYSLEELSARSGVPESTIQKVLSGTSRSPRKATLDALSNVLCEPMTAYQVTPRVHTLDEIFELPDDVWAELIDGEIYYMGHPKRLHQEICGEMHLAVANHIRSRGGKCKVFIPPFGVYLNGDNSIFLLPDLTVVCDTSKLDEDGCKGAPDWVVEVLSPSTSTKDLTIKLQKYWIAGVREYWIIDPQERSIHVYQFHGEEATIRVYSFEDAVPSGIFPDLTIRLADVL